MTFRQLSLLALLPTVILAAGCGSGAKSTEPNGLLATESEPLSEEPKEFTPDQMAFADRPDESVLTEVIQGRKVYVGDPIDEVFALVPRAPRSFPMTEVPAGLSAAFEVKGWETRLGSVGFISTGQRLALMLEVLDQAGDNEVQERLAQTQEANGPATTEIVEGSVKYWFWERAGSRIMLCATPDREGRTTLAAALGNPSLMTALRMNPELAKIDAVRANELLKVESAPEPVRSGAGTK